MQHLDQFGQLAAQAAVRAGAEEGIQEVGRVRVVGDPAVEEEIGLARAHLLQIGAPVVGDDLGLDADVRQVRLQRLADPVGVGEVGPARCP